MILVFCCTLEAKSQYIVEKKVEDVYFYRLAEQAEFFNNESGRIDATWLSFERIGVPYQTAIRDYLFAKMDSLQINHNDLLSISIMADSSGKAVYCHIISFKQLTEYDKLEQLFRYGLQWQKPFPQKPSNNPNSLYLFSFIFE